jgi:hypothetical protein
MERIHQGNGFAIIESGDKIQITWTQGPYGYPVFYDISKENMEKALKSEKDAYKVMVYAETGKWPLEKDEQMEKKKAFVRRFPELLIKVPENQDLFDEEELKMLLEQINKGL